MEVAHAPYWQVVSIRVADHLAPDGQVKLHLRASDYPDDDTVEALVDDFRLDRIVETPALWADAYSISAAAGGEVSFTLEAGAENRGRPYCVLGSMTGTWPGIPLAGGAQLPLVWDAFSGAVLRLHNSAHFDGFRGMLDDEGKAWPVFNTLGALPGALTGLRMHFACLLPDGPCFASNAVSLDIAP
jgi:hypothetical protein